MILKEDNQHKKASLVLTNEKNQSIQKECLVNLQDGMITVGDDKISGRKFDYDSKLTNQRIEFRGKEFEIENIVENKTPHIRLKEPSWFAFEAQKPEPKHSYDNIKHKIPKPN